MASSVSLTFLTELTAKWRETIGKDPIEQSQLGNRFLDLIERDFETRGNQSDHLQFPVRFRASSTGKWYDDGDLTTVTTPEEVTMADERAARFVEGVHLWRAEERRLMGTSPAKMFDLLSERLNSMRMRMKNAVAAQAMASSHTSKQIIGLPEMAPQSPGSTTLHGISASTHSDWANQVQDIGGGGAISSNVDNLRLLIEKCRKYGEAEPTHIIGTRATKLALIEAAYGKTEIQVMPGDTSGGRGVDLSYRRVFVDGLEFIDDRFATAQILHVVSKDALRFIVDENFIVEGPIDLRPNQQGVVWQGYFSGQFVCKERSALGHGYNFTEA